MVNSPDCCTSLFSSQLTLALTLCANWIVTSHVADAVH